LFSTFLCSSILVNCFVVSARLFRAEETPAAAGAGSGRHGDGEDGARRSEGHRQRGGLRLGVHQGPGGGSAGPGEFPGRPGCGEGATPVRHRPPALSRRSPAGRGQPGPG